MVNKWALNKKKKLIYSCFMACSILHYFFFCEKKYTHVRIDLHPSPHPVKKPTYFKDIIDYYIHDFMIKNTRPNDSSHLIFKHQHPFLHS